MTYFIDLRADSRGGNPAADVKGVVIRTDAQPNPSRPLDAELKQAIQGRDVLLGTHGFNVTRDCGIDYLGHWSQWLQLGANGFFVAVLWPGDSRWLPVLDYPVEDKEAIKSAELLAEYLMENFTEANSLSFTSHSLGARMVLETIGNLSQSSFKLRTLTIMAGAIDDTCLNGQYKTALSRMEKISVLASNCDDVLKWAFPAGNPFAGIVSRGEPYWHGALGHYGPNPPNQPANLNQTPTLPDKWKFGHGSYIDYQAPNPGQQSSGPYFPPALVVPPQGTEPPQPCLLNWQQAWAAGFVSTRFS
jgi:hypothetical protein